MENKSEEYKEPEWMNPANDPKTPYTEEELEEFAEGFKDAFPGHYKKLLCRVPNFNSLIFQFISDWFTYLQQSMLHYRAEIAM